MVDHAEEHTIEMILDGGYWAGLTLYPQTKVSAAARRRHDRAVWPGPHLRRRRLRLGPERSARRAAVRRWRCGAAYPADLIHRVVFENPVRFLSQSPKFSIRPAAAAEPVREAADADRLDDHASLPNRDGFPTHLLHQHPSRRRVGGGSLPTFDDSHRPSKPGSRLGAVRPRVFASRRGKRGSCWRATGCDEFSSFLDEQGLYVAIINGFPHGAVSSGPSSKPTCTRLTGAMRRAFATPIDLIRDPAPAAARRCRRRRVDGAAVLQGVDGRRRTEGVGLDRANVVRVAERLVRRPRRPWRADPPRHRARARLPAREHRRDDGVL